MKRWIPSPPLSLTLFVVWLLLNQSLHLATLLLAVVLAIVVPLLTQGLRPAPVSMRRPGVALQLFGHVVVDVVRSALAVGRRLLTPGPLRIASHFVPVPMDMRDGNGLAVLAMIVCLTPGTAWAEISLDQSTLLIHVFDLDDEPAFIALIKQRYERPLMEIFES